MPRERAPRRGRESSVRVSSPARGERGQVPRGGVERTHRVVHRLVAHETQEGLVERHRRPRPDRTARIGRAANRRRRRRASASAEEDVHAEIERAAVDAEEVGDAPLDDVAAGERGASGAFRRVDDARTDRRLRVGVVDSVGVGGAERPHAAVGGSLDEPRVGDVARVAKRAGDLVLGGVLGERDGRATGGGREVREGGFRRERADPGEVVRALA